MVPPGTPVNSRGEAYSRDLLVGGMPAWQRRNAERASAALRAHNPGQIRREAGPASGDTDYTPGTAQKVTVVQPAGITVTVQHDTGGTPAITANQIAR